MQHSLPVFNYNGYQGWYQGWESKYGYAVWRSKRMVSCHRLQLFKHWNFCALFQLHAPSARGTTSQQSSKTVSIAWIALQSVTCRPHPLFSLSRFSRICLSSPGATVGCSRRSASCTTHLWWTSPLSRPFTACMISHSVDAPIWSTPHHSHSARPCAMRILETVLASSTYPAAQRL